MIRTTAVLLLLAPALLEAQARPTPPTTRPGGSVLKPPATAPVAAPPSFEDPRIHDIVRAASAQRMEADIRKLVSFGTRHTMSDTVSQTRGIGAARR